jgi:hypothetical protein
VWIFVLCVTDICSKSISLHPYVTSPKLLNEYKRKLNLVTRVYTEKYRDEFSFGLYQSNIKREVGDELVHFIDKCEGVCLDRVITCI